MSTEDTIEQKRVAIEQAYKIWKQLVLDASAEGYEVRIQTDDTVILIKIVGKVLAEDNQ